MNKVATAAPSVNFAAFVALVADDDVTVRALVAKMLVNMGFKTVLQAASGADTIKEIQRQQPDIVICDVEMPPSSGIEVLKTLRKSGSAYARTLPFIFLTGHSEPDVVNGAREWGVNAFLLKPVKADTLADRVGRLLASAAPRPR